VERDKPKKSESVGQTLPPFFISMATAAKFILPIAIFLAYLIQLDVDVTTSTFSGTR
jgi:hypothetical protein